MWQAPWWLCPWVILRSLSQTFTLRKAKRFKTRLNTCGFLLHRVTEGPEARKACIVRACVLPYYLWILCLANRLQRDPLFALRAFHVSRFKVR